MKEKIMSGNEACANVSYMFTEIAGVYPITPSSPIPEQIEELKNKHKKNIFDNEVKLIEMQSEKGAIATVHGALLSGSLASSYTSSQGLLLMLPSMYKIAGEMLPCVINVASRTVATHALSILSDHSDIYAVRSSGFNILASTNVQDVEYMTLISYLSAIKLSTPFINFFDGFITSHETNKINVINDSDIKSLIPKKELEDFKRRSLVINKKIVGTNQNDDIYFQNLEARNKLIDEVPDTINEYMEKINKKFNTNYKPFNYYGKKDATKVIVAMGSVCDTIKEYIDLTDENVGLIEVHLFRPFSFKYFLDVLPNDVKEIAVLDRAKEQGSEALYLDVVDAINKSNRKIDVIGGRYGISSKNTNLNQIGAVYKNLSTERINSFTVGIDDDVTFKSLKVEELDLKENKNNIEILIYGNGGDGMVSSSKNLIKLIGENTSAYIQGFSKYDSKKMGGLTRTNLRIGKKRINLPYDIEKAHILVCTDDSYLDRYDLIKNIRKNGTFILVTDKEEVSEKTKYYLALNNIKFYKIDAKKIARENKLNNKLGTIIETAIINITKLLPYELYLEKVKEEITNKYETKGKEIVENNINAIEKVSDSIKEIKIPKEWNEIIIKQNEKQTFIEKINSLKGNELKVSEFLKHKDGSYETFTSSINKYNAETLPNWKSDICIECNKCSLACPHGVIVPKILTKEELESNKDAVYIPLTGKEGYNFALEIDYDKCTGCGECANICTGKRGMKAIEMLPSEVTNKINQKINATQKNLFDENTIKGVGFNEPLFRFPSACPSCGETPYLKLLTKVHKDGIIIANATGCSSIYGGDIINPYNISFANSLFEDNAEFGYGIQMTIKLMNEQIEDIMRNNLNKVKSKNKKLFTEWLENKYDYEITKNIRDNIDYSEIKELEPLKDYIATKSVWLVGGDGWSYDIDFDGIDHIMASNENINILILNTEVYSNTGGQASKSTDKAATTKFNKTTSKKDLARMMMTYDNVYVAQISLGANMLQSIKALKEAEKFNGPSLIIAYAPCKSHGISKNTMDEEKLAVQSGYYPLFRYNGALTLDYTEPDFNLYKEFLDGEKRFKILEAVNKEHAKKLYEESKKDAINRFNYYKSISKK